MDNASDKIKRDFFSLKASALCALSLNKTNIVYSLLRNLLMFRQTLGISLPEIIELISQEHFWPIENELRRQIGFLGLGTVEEEKILNGIKKILKESVDSKPKKCDCGRTCGCARSLSGLSNEERKLILETD